MTGYATLNVLASWMRVHIAVQRGDIPGAADYARAAAEVTKWDKIKYHSWDLNFVHAVDFLPPDFVWADPANSRVALNADTYFTLTHDETTFDTFMTDMLKGARGLKRISCDAGPYAAAGAARRAQDAEEQEELGGTVVDAAGDRLALLEAEMKAILGRLRTGDADVARKALGQLLQAKERLTQLRADLQRIEGLYEAVSDAYDDIS